MTTNIRNKSRFYLRLTLDKPSGRIQLQEKRELVTTSASPLIPICINRRIKWNDLQDHDPFMNHEARLNKSLRRLGPAWWQYGPIPPINFLSVLWAEPFLHELSRRMPVQHQRPLLAA